MKEPDVWPKLGSYIHQDFALDHDDFTQGVINTALSFSVEERAELAKYLAYLADESRPGGTMKAAWNKSGADWFPALRDRNAWLDFYNEIAIGISEAKR